jgi:thioredoxin reductase
METPARIAVLGAGPIGLEAALYARYLGYTVDIYERGTVAEHVRRWGHVRMFSPFGGNCSPLGLAALAAQDASWQPPGEDALLTGREFAERYLAPLARSDLLVDGLHERTEVLAVSRDGLLHGELVGDELREDRDLRLLLRTISPDGHATERTASADAVIDATGTFGRHNWLGAAGMPAIGELAAEPHIEYGLPDVLGADRPRFASRNVLLVGDGDSAATNLVALAELAAQARDTWITWVTRRRPDADSPHPPLRELEGDPLPDRLKLARRANRLAADDANHVSHLGDSAVEAIHWHGDLERFVVRLAGRHAGEMEFDQVVASVGHRADASLFAELNVAAPLAAAARTIQSPSGLLTGEPDFYVLGAKRLDRDSRFLISQGLAEIRELFAIIGDRRDLDLYATMGPLGGHVRGA